MNNMNREASKMNKSQLIQLLDQKIDDFLDLATSVHRSTGSNISKSLLLSALSGLTWDLYHYDPDSDDSVLSKGCKERFISLFMETINIIFVISVNDMLYFILNAAKVDPKSNLFMALKKIICESNDPYILESDVCYSIISTIAHDFIYPHRNAFIPQILIETRIRSFADELRIYRTRISQQWKDDPEYTFQIQRGEFVMKGDSYSVGNITNANVSGFVQGEHNTVVANLNAAGQPELAQALSTLTQVVNWVKLARILR